MIIIIWALKQIFYLVTVTIHAKKLLICLRKCLLIVNCCKYGVRKKEMKYIINHELAPYFKYILTEDIDSADFLSVCFNKSLNKTTQNCEMDLILQYWDNVENKVQVYYWNNLFLGHGTTSNLFKTFDQALKKLN